MIRSASVLLILVSSPALAFGQGRLGVDFTRRLIQLVPGVYAYEGPLNGFCCDLKRKVPLKPGEQDIVRTNSLVVVTDEGVVVADGQPGRGPPDACRDPKGHRQAGAIRD